MWHLINIAAPYTQLPLLRLFDFQFGIYLFRKYFWLVILFHYDLRCTQLVFRENSAIGEQETEKNAAIFICQSFIRSIEDRNDAVSPMKQPVES